MTDPMTDPMYRPSQYEILQCLLRGGLEAKNGDWKSHRILAAAVESISDELPADERCHGCAVTGARCVRALDPGVQVRRCSVCVLKGGKCSLVYGAPSAGQRWRHTFPGLEADRAWWIWSIAAVGLVTGTAAVALAAHLRRGGN